MRDGIVDRSELGRSRSSRSVRRPGSEIYIGRIPERVSYSRQTLTINTVVEVTETLVTDPVQAPQVILRPHAGIAATEKTLAVTQQALQSEVRKGRDLRRFGLIFIASIFILVTGYVSIDTIITNNRVKAQTARTTTNNAVLPDGQTTTAETATDTSAIPASALANYQVASSLPRLLYSSDLKVAARILPMSVTIDGNIQAPRNINDAGWYSGSVKPGEPGAVFIDGHASGASRQGLFGYLYTLKPGNELQVEKGDGSRLTYRVMKVDTVALDAVDMKKVLQPYEGVTNGLNLMTCTGAWVNSEKTYDQRVIVWTQQV